MLAATENSTDVMRVLLVDDCEDDAVITRDILSDIPSITFEVDWVSCFEDGLERMKQDRYDVDLLDYHIGSRSGLDLLREVHGQVVHPPVIMLTGQGAESVVLEAMRAGASDYIPKQLLSPETLERAISHAVEKSRLQKNLDEHHDRLEQANEELSKQYEEIQRFYHVLAHELKTPLTAAGEFVEIMLEELAGPLTSDQREYLEIVNGCCDSLKQNINDLFDITRLETGKLSVEIQSDDLVDLIRQVVSTFVPIARNRGVSLQCSLAPDLPYVFMDRHRIRQVLSNLLSNALKFSSKGGSVRVKVTDDVVNPDSVIIAVSDTGKGIPSEQVNQIFDRLYQIRNDHSPAVAGLGLGLFISQQLVKLHNGTLSVQSQIGEGSTFSFTLRKATAGESSTTV
ncbi:MAG: ATP-binding protein [Nitrospirales bacterium]